MQAIRLRKPHNKGDGPPVFSHEFIIQNHADIISCVCMVIFMMLIPEFTNPLASSLIFVQHNKTVFPPEPKLDPNTVRVDVKPLPETYYLHGWKDLPNVVFYSLIWIIIHALLQEYIWERSVKRLHLSKVKTAKYFDSGCLVVFYLLSLLWGVDYIIKEGYMWNWPLLWEDYPHSDMRLSLKFYMLNQMAFWLHCYPELYFMKTKKEDLYSKVVLYTSSLLMIAGAYLVSLQRLAVILLVLHYSVEFLFHAARLLHYHSKDDFANPIFKVWRGLFVLVRVLTIFFSVLTLWFGLGVVQGLRASDLTADSPTEPPPPPVEGEGEGGENVTEVGEGGEPEGPDIDFTHWGYRLLGLSFIVVLQLWIGWTFLNSQLERSSDKPTKKISRKGESKKNGKTSKPPTKPKTS